ncbi:DUF2306 domain-containing protein [Paenibacillus contaminans]|nr:DUF2306 domain-containing protein [Paenibacillus contaminans]
MVAGNQKVRKGVYGLLAVLAIAVGAYALVLYGMPEGLRNQAFVTEKGKLPELWYNVLWAHAVSSGIALAVGWVQFAKKMRRRNPGVHRVIGYVFAAAVAVGGSTGLYLACYANGGLFAQTGFTALSVLWLYTLYLSLKSIVGARNTEEHGRWMTRCYALTCAAIALRIYTPLAAVLFGVTDTNDSFVVIAWLCWVPNLVIAEFFINRNRSFGTRRI